MKSIFKKIISNILILESKIILKKYNPKIISVTGSVGKTSTKDAIYTALSKKYYIRKSYKSFNSEIGVPLTILGCQNGWNDPIIWIKNIFYGLELIIFKSKYPKYLVLEIGADHPGDIERMSKWLKSDIVVLTKISEIPVHVEFFNSPLDVLKEKFSLTKSLKKDGVLIIPSDDNRITNLSKEIKNKIITFSIDNVSNIFATNIEEKYLDGKLQGMNFNINYNNEIYPACINGVLGKQQVYPLIISIAVALANNDNIKEIIDALNNHIPPRGRMNIISGINESIIIDDSYNSSPDALKEALFAIEKIKNSGRKIAILGDMMELGKFSSEEHKKIGDLTKRICNILITVGPRAKLIDKDAIHFDNSIDAGEYVKNIIGKDDLILIKGSQSIRMERIVKMIMLDKSMSENLLVRQESEWLAKK